MADVFDNSLNFQTTIGTILSDSTLEYKIEFYFKFTSGLVAIVNPEQIIQLTLEQNYYANFNDTILLSLNLTAGQLNNLLENRRELIMQICWSKVESRKTTPLYRQEYMVNILESGDKDLVLGKRNYSFRTAYDTDKPQQHVSVHLELIDRTVYELKKKRMAFILHNATMKEALLTVAQLQEFEKVYIYEPDNKTVYPNLIIPPLQSITTVFDYLQHTSKYDGVYLTGLNYYIQQGVLFVFPLQNSVSSGKRCNIYNAGKTLGEGAVRFFNVSNTTLNLAIVDPVESYDDTHVRIESNYTWADILTPKEVLGHYPLVGTTVDIKNDIISNYSIDAEHLGLTNSVFNHEYFFENNKSRITEELYSNGISALRVFWRNALPFLIRPDIETHYIAETPNGVKNVACIVSKVVYVFSPVQNASNTTFRCDATLTLLINKVIKEV